MDGFALYKELKRNKLTADIPVLILTARGQMEGTFEAVGADDFLPKPFDAQTLIDKVETLLTRVRQAAQMAHGKKVLIAGTDNEVLDNMGKQLRKIGCHVDVVTTGPQVISKTVMFLPMILIIEAQMDGMSAEEVLKVIRKLPQAERIPILVYSFYRLSDLGSEDVRQKALSVDSAVRGCLDSGATEYFGRFNESTFLQVLGKYL
jgi:DNA-binding response OmpR family regulator